MIKTNCIKGIYFNFMALLSTFLLLGCQQNGNHEIPLVAHAGGGIDGKRYTNSIEALNFNYEKGFRLFEIDFSWTSDNQLVCLHDWKETAKRLFDYEAELPLSYKSFKAETAQKSVLEPCDLYSLNQWLHDHPDAKIITDIKGKNFEGLKLIVDVVDDAQNKVIPQFTQSEHYPKISTLNFNDHIWTLFSYQGSIEKLIKEAPKMKLFAITMPPSKAKNQFAKAIQKIHIPTYVHTINDLNDAINYQNAYAVTSVYTDFLEPNALQQKTTAQEG